MRNYEGRGLCYMPKPKACSPGDLASVAKFRILSSIPRFIPNSAFYPQFRVLSPIPVPHSGSVFRFRIPFPHSGSAFYPYPFAFVSYKGCFWEFKNYSKLLLSSHRSYANVVKTLKRSLDRQHPHKFTVPPKNVCQLLVKMLFENDLAPYPFIVPASLGITEQQTRWKHQEFRHG